MKNRIPEHIGIIPDGNRRWAVRNGLDKRDGYAFGLQAGLKLYRLAKAIGVRELTFYGFTVDNCKRPSEQVEAFAAACVEAVELMKNEDVSVRVIGNTQSKCFPKALLPYTKNSRTEGEKMRVNLLVNYGWEWDIDSGWASKAVPRIDMVMRWGGMRRLSGFLPLQTVYADFYVADELWPDYSDEQFLDAIEWYGKQDITLGG